MTHGSIRKHASMISFAVSLSLSPLSALAQQMPPANVTVMTAEVAQHVITKRLPGRVKASTVAEVRPQISGIISERLFDEGEWVESGQPLYKIEDEVYRADVEAAEAAVAQAQASYDLAVLDAHRAEDLFSKNAGSGAARDTALANRAQAAAGLQSAKAQLSRAQINLNRTTITAPVSGVIGLSQTTTGSLVSAQQATALTTIRTLDPVYVDVTQSVNDLLEWGRASEPQAFFSEAEATLLLPNGDVYDHKGQLRAAEPQVEPTTGMVTLRISVPNPQYRLLPGLYIEVELPQAETAEAVLVPQSVVMRAENGDASVWVVEGGKIAERDVSIVGSSGRFWVVNGGLNSGDQIVTSGFQKAGPGAEVQIIPAEGQSAPAAAAEGN
ncbi:MULTISPECIES: efflux RND transporter periplasmic adaptor subunit [Actibacterium]|uniref:Membrane fusion protein (Multidrug efflux system) n=1 Tax=Actibacterium naphthalenivorans TaxID=1614693 RepID=A0A840CGA3_9RHOB|nr:MULTISPECIES: efflux RND transporter periplasmic adaptor subunit [Actibacterium]ALG90854.1 hemolysin D [Actibacterium sp. EMB200-NS6]MBB4023843.1 membrane fusion protein (multidrug efflux system) [Actibacterium naphthalenivorans]